MKKTTFTFLALITFFGAYAQIAAGTMLIGGEIGLDFDTYKSKSNGTTTTDGKSTSITLEPQFGYFVIDNVAIGGVLSVSTSTFKPEGSDGKSTFTSLAIGPFARYYFGNIFGQGQFLIGSAKDKDTFGGTTNEEKYGLTQWSIGAGYAAFLNDHVAIEPMLGYGSTIVADKSEGVTGDPKDITSGLFIRVGVQVYLR